LTASGRSAQLAAIWANAESAGGDEDGPAMQCGALSCGDDGTTAGTSPLRSCRKTFAVLGFVACVRQPSELRVAGSSPAAGTEVTRYGQGI
jgi:hypothetical protein